jgi:hypothetical protein
LPEAPAIRLAVASKAACIFSLTISLASRRALLPPRISFIIRSAITPFASTANNIKELTICPLCIAAYQDERAEMVPDSALSDGARNKAWEAVVAILEPGQFFGEGCMNGRDDNSDGRLRHHVHHQRSDDGGYS